MRHAGFIAAMIHRGSATLEVLQAANWVLEFDSYRTTVPSLGYCQIESNRPALKPAAVSLRCRGYTNEEVKLTSDNVRGDACIQQACMYG